ncbi:nucleoside-diphosphate-sugar epimerase [Kitasatospora acidiphila]
MGVVEMRSKASRDLRLSGSVMTHPKRREAAERLAANAPEGALSVVMDPDPTGTPSVLRTALAAWRSIAPDATHHLLLQDDMILSDSFFERVHRAVEEMPDAALSLFCLWDSRNGAAVRLGALAGARWVEAVNEYTPTVAIVLPRRAAVGFAEYGARRLGSWPDDILMRGYLRAEGIRSFVAVPNLTEHDDKPSLSGNAFRGPRRSVCFLPGDPARDEHRRLAGLSVAPFFKNGVARCSVRIPGSAPTRWQDIDAEQYLAGQGVDLDRLRSRLRGIAIDPRTPGLWGTWLTSFVTGLVDGTHQTVQQPDQRRDSAALSEALASIGPGGLSHNRSEQDLDAARGELRRVSELGVAAGVEAAALAVPGRPRRRRPGRAPEVVAVLGGNTPLGEFVVRGLRDRGHQVRVLDLRTPDGTLPDVDYGVIGRSGDARPARELASADAVVDLSELRHDRPPTAPGTDATETTETAERMDARDRTERMDARDRTETADAGDATDVSSARRLRDAAAARSPHALLIRVSPFPAAEHPGPLEYFLHPGDLYGPGCARDSVIGRMVWQALLSRPIVPALRPEESLHPLHVDDLVNAVSVAIRTRPTARALALGTPCSVADVAAAIQRVVRPVPVEHWHAALAGPGQSAAPGDRLPGWRAGVDLAYGLHTFAQWLAYEGEHGETD